MLKSGTQFKRDPSSTSITKSLILEFHYKSRENPHEQSLLITLRPVMLQQIHV